MTMATDRELLQIQEFVSTGFTFEESGLPRSLRADWDRISGEVMAMHDNGVIVATENEWSEWTTEALDSLYRELSEEELADLIAGVQKAEDATLVSKAVDERMFTLGPMYIPNRRDAHAEWTDPDELQKAVWDYVKKGDRRIRLQHNRDVVAGEWVEIMAWPYEVEAPILMKDATQTSMTFPANTVFLGVKWEPWAWDMIKAGKLRGYSIGGRAERLLADLPEGDVEKASVPLEAPAPAPTAMEIGEQIAAAVSEAMKAITPVVNVVMPDDKPKVRRVERDEHGNILRLIEE